MQNERCCDCSFFMQHYCLDNRKLFRVYCGHCMLKRPKHKLPDAKACGSFIKKRKEDAFVTKEYLSKALLKYVLELELLPEIQGLSAEE